MLSILLVIYHTFGLAFRTRLNFTQPGAIAIRDLHIVTLAPYAIRQSAIGLYRRQVMAQGRGQGAGRPSTGSTGAIVSVFLGRDSEARELRVKLEVIHSCIDRLIGASVSEPPLGGLNGRAVMHDIYIRPAPATAHARRYAQT